MALVTRSASVSSLPPARQPIAYRRHRPEQTVLYQLIERYYPAFLAAIEISGVTLPFFVRREFEDYLKCGLLEHILPWPLDRKDCDHLRLRRGGARA